MIGPGDMNLAFLLDELLELCDDADRRRSFTGELDSEAFGNGDLTTMQVRAILEPYTS